VLVARAIGAGARAVATLFESRVWTMSLKKRKRKPPTNKKVVRSNSVEKETFWHACSQVAHREAFATHASAPRTYAPTHPPTHESPTKRLFFLGCVARLRAIVGSRGSTA
jgi:hypothetical protein